MTWLPKVFAPAWLILAMMSLQAMAEDPAALVDWPQFHGPTRNNTTSETGWRKAWPQNGPPVAWKTKVGAGMASFAVVGDHVFTAGNDGENQDTVFCLDLATGKPVWRHDYPCKSAAHMMSIVPGGPCATPCVGDGHVFTVSREGDVFCMEAATGKVVWQKNLLRDFQGRRPVYGYAGSPLLWQGRLFLDAGGEFGRTPMSEKGDGRDHNPTGFTMWMAGGGVQGGRSHGATDELGLYAVEDRLRVHDIHATILHLLGIDHTRLIYPHMGRPERIDQNEGHPYTKLLGA